MKYFIDSEFCEDGKTIDLISIGIINEYGRSYYAINKECQFWKANEWVVEHVLPKIRGDIEHEKTREEIKRDLLDFVNSDPLPEFWGYYADYDWVVLCQLFGRMVDLPGNWPKYCNDVKQFCFELGNLRLPKQGKDEHHALADARWVKSAWEYLDDVKCSRIVPEVKAEVHGMQ
jgi:hypothetical protein